MSKGSKKHPVRSLIMFIIFVAILVVVFIQFGTDFSFIDYFGGNNSEKSEKGKKKENIEKKKTEEITEVQLDYKSTNGKNSILLGGKELDFENWQEELKEELSKMKELKVVRVNNMNEFAQSWLDYLDDLEEEFNIEFKDSKAGN